MQQKHSSPATSSRRFWLFVEDYETPYLHRTLSASELPRAMAIIALDKRFTDKHLRVREAPWL